MAELGPPPPGGDQNRAPELLGITWAFNAAALLLVGFRLVTRHIVIRNPGWDDYLIYASVVSMPNPRSYSQISPMNFK